MSRAHRGRVNKKPSKVRESASSYAAKKPAKDAAADKSQQVRYIDPERARKLTKEILDKHHDLFRKLAQ